MAEQTKQEGMPLWYKGGIIGLIAIVLGLALFLTYESVALRSRIDSNIQFIKSQGFNAEKGYFSGFAPFVRISNITTFLTLARNWNITTIFVDTGDGEMFFTYQGLIYAHW